jgi:predicted RNA-binding protein
MKFKYYLIIILPILFLPSFMLGTVNKNISIDKPFVDYQIYIPANNNELNNISIIQNAQLDQLKTSSYEAPIINLENQKKQPTRTPRPTPTPLVIPPPADPNSSNLIVLLGILSVLIVLVGVWLNRKQLY